MGAWGCKGEKDLGGERLELHLSGYPRAKGRGEDRNMILEGGEDPWMERLGFKILFSFLSFTQALSYPSLSSLSFSHPSGYSLFSTWHGSSWTGTLPTKVSAGQGPR